MTVYLGDKAVGVNTIVEKEVAKTKFGATIDALLGDVDADGGYNFPTEPFEVNLVGVKKFNNNHSFRNKFSHTIITKFMANDLIELPLVTGQHTFYRCCYGSTYLKEVHFDNLETVSADYAFGSAFSNCSGLEKITFAKLKKISGNHSFESIAGNSGSSSDPLNINEMFPVLEEVSGGVFANFVSFSLYTNNTKPIIFPAVKKINGGSGQYSGVVFGNIFYVNTLWHFPSATEFTGYIWNGSASYPGEIHFAAANQAAIEACEGYDYKWGFAGATIYFDL